MAKGLNIQIGADTTKLANALKQSNNLILSTTRELNKFDKLLKDVNKSDPKTLIAKYGALSEKIKNLNDKLKILKETEEQYQKKGKLEYKTKEFRDLQFQIEQTTQELKKTNSELNKMSNFELNKQNLKINALNTNIKQTRNELDRVNLSIKSSSGIRMTQLLNDKQILLNNTISNTQKKYNELNHKLEVLKRTGNSLNLSEEIIRTKREMLNCENAIIELRKELKSASEIRFERVIRDVEILDKEIKENVKSSKNLEEAIKNSTKSEKIEILKEKYKLLENNIKSTQEKIKMLIQQRDMISKTDSEGNLTEKYKKLTIEISKSKEELKKFNQEISKKTKFSSYLDDAEKKISSVSNKMSGISNASNKILGVSTIAGGLAGKQFAEFEKALIGVEKTTNASADEMAKFKEEILRISRVVPSTQSEIADLMMIAGQLGIKKKDISEFSKTIIDLANSSNILGEEGATQMAQYANVTNMLSKDYRRFGSTIVALGNNSATTEKDILKMAQRIGASGSMAGYSNAEILAYSATLASLGIEAEAGGTAFSKFFNKLDNASKEGVKSLSAYAKIAGMSAKEFAKLYSNDRAQAVQKFFTGLNNISKSGKSVAEALESIDAKEARLSDALRRMANGHELLGKTMQISKQGWEENTALSNEANKAYESVSAQTAMLMNKSRILGITMGEKLIPYFKTGADVVDKMTNKISKMNDKEIKDLVNTTMLIIGFAGGFKILHGTIKTVEGSIYVINNLRKATEGFSKASSTLAGATTMWGGVLFALSLVAMQAKNRADEIQNANKSISDSFSNGLIGMGETLKNVNDEYQVFYDKQVANSKSFSELKYNESKIEQEIGQIREKGILQTRKLTEEEITLIEKKIKKLSEISDKQIKVLSAQMTTQTEVYKNELRNYDGSIAGFVELKEKKVKTLEKGLSEQLELLNKQKTDEIMILQDKHKGEDLENSEQYKTSLEALNKNFNEREKILKENNAKEIEEIKKVNNDKAVLDDETLAKLDKYNFAVEEAKKRHHAREEEIKKKYKSNSKKYHQEIEKNNKHHEGVMAKINESITSELTEENQKQIAAMALHALEVESNGGLIQGKNAEVALKIKKAYENLPDEFKKKAKEFMNGMIEGMNSKYAEVKDKARHYSKGILQAVGITWDVRSPSRKTKQLSEFFMDGIPAGMKAKQQSVLNTTKKMASSIIKAFDLDSFNKMNNLATDVAIKAQTKTVITTPNITFNVPQMTDAELDRAFNYMNKKFGGAY